MINFNGFYIGKKNKISIEAPTLDGGFSYDSVFMIRFYEDFTWIRANTLDTQEDEFMVLTNSLQIGDFESIKKNGGLFFKTTRNHNLDGGIYEVSGDTLYIFWEVFLQEDNDQSEALISEIFEFEIKKNLLVQKTNTGGINFSFRSL